MKEYDMILDEINKELPVENKQIKSL